MPEIGPEATHRVGLGQGAEQRRPLPRLVDARGDEDDGQQVVEAGQVEDVRDELVRCEQGADLDLAARDGGRGRPGGPELVEEAEQDGFFLGAHVVRVEGADGGGHPVLVEVG